MYTIFLNYNRWTIIRLSQNVRRRHEYVILVYANNNRGRHWASSEDGISDEYIDYEYWWIKLAIC